MLIQKVARGPERAFRPRPERIRKRRYLMDHSKDSDCTLDSTDICVVCGTYHGDPCPVCGGRGFHKEGCEVIQ